MYTRARLDAVARDLTMVNCGSSFLFRQSVENRLSALTQVELQLRSSVLRTKHLSGQLQKWRRRPEVLLRVAYVPNARPLHILHFCLHFCSMCIEKYPVVACLACRVHVQLPYVGMRAKLMDEFWATAVGSFAPELAVKECWQDAMTFSRFTPLLIANRKRGRY